MTFLRFTPVAVLALLLVGCGSGGPGDTAADFARAAASGDGERVVELLDPAMAQSLGPKISATVSSQAGEAAAKGGLSEVNILDETVNGDNATVRIETVMGDGSRSEETIQLRKIDGDWKVVISK
ncbi:MAG: DUF4878 domain-containing protein [Bacteroidota bacterium]